MVIDYIEIIAGILALIAGIFPILFRERMADNNYQKNVRMSKKLGLIGGILYPVPRDWEKSRTRAIRIIYVSGIVSFVAGIGLIVHGVFFGK